MHSLKGCTFTGTSCTLSFFLRTFVCLVHLVRQLFVAEGHVVTARVYLRGSVRVLILIKNTFGSSSRLLANVLSIEASFYQVVELVLPRVGPYSDFMSCLVMRKGGSDGVLFLFGGRC